MDQSTQVDLAWPETMAIRVKGTYRINITGIPRSHPVVHQSVGERSCS